MPIPPLQKFLLTADRVCDYLPGISMLNNAVDLVARGMLSTKDQRREVWPNHYYRHIQNKETWRSLLLLFVPVIGNFIVGIYDYYHRDDSTRKVSLHPSDFKDLPKALRDDEEFVLQIIQNTPPLSLNMILPYVSDRLKQSNADIMAAALRKDGTLIKEFPNKSLISSEIARTAVAGGRCPLTEIPAELWNKELLLSAVAKTANPLIYMRSWLERHVEEGKEIVEQAACKPDFVEYYAHIPDLFFQDTAFLKKIVSLAAQRTYNDKAISFLTFFCHFLPRLPEDDATKILLTGVMRKFKGPGLSTFPDNSRWRSDKEIIGSAILDIGWEQIHRVPASHSDFNELFLIAAEQHGDITPLLEGRRDLSVEQQNTLKQKFYERNPHTRL